MACRDATGYDDDYIATGSTMDELYNNMHHHLKEKHDYKDPPPRARDYENIISQLQGPWKEAFDESQKNNFKDIGKIVEEKMK
jgi:hypothetical protein